MPKKLSRIPADPFSCDMMWDHADGNLEPLTEITDNENELIVKVDMPCVKNKEDIEVVLTENTVTVEAKMCKVVQYEHWGTFQRESKFFRYSKTFTLPASIEPERSKARFIKNVLELRLPKRDLYHKIKIQ